MKMDREFDRPIFRGPEEEEVSEKIAKAINRTMARKSNWVEPISVVIEALVDQIAYLHVEIEKLKEKQNA
jgi:hypothetical protein